MPRLYDYSRNPETSSADYIWMRYNAPIHGKRECDIADMLGPFGSRVAFALKHQFELDLKDGRHPYQNEVVDPVFLWLENELKGPWNWREAMVNEGRSMSTRLYIKNKDDQHLFMKTWGGLFKFSQSVESQNEQFEQRLVESISANVMPPWATTSVLTYVFLSLVPEDYEKIASFSDRTDYIHALSLGFEAAVASLDEIEPSRFGPLYEDGTWGTGMLDLFRDLSRWLDTHAPLEVRDIGAKSLAHHPKVARFLDLGRAEVQKTNATSADTTVRLS